MPCSWYAAPRNNVFGGTAAMSAAYEGHDQCSQILDDAKADLDVQEAQKALEAS